MSKTKPTTMAATDSSSMAQSPANFHPGITCRHCGCQHFITVYTRRRNDGIIRRKRCRNCNAAITTREKICGTSQ